jgi:hypothetical protein
LEVITILVSIITFNITVFNPEMRMALLTRDCLWLGVAVTYLQHSAAGISVYGFVLNRDFLYAVFAIEFSLTLFILGKTIVL